MHHIRTYTDMICWGWPSFPTNCKLRDLPFSRLKWLPAALHTIRSIPVRNNNLHEGTLQPARRSNPQAVVKSVTAPNQTARSFFVIYNYYYLCYLCLDHYLVSPSHIFCPPPSCPLSNFSHISCWYIQPLVLISHTEPSFPSIYIIIYFFSFLHTYTLTH